MTEISYSEALAQELKGKVIVLTGKFPQHESCTLSLHTSILGGAQGIGAATVLLYKNLGAYVYFGDWDEAAGRRVEQEAQSSSSRGSAHFQKLDVRDHSSQVSLFDSAFKDHGHVDVAISCAAVKDPGGWFEPKDLDLETVKRVRILHTEPSQPLN